MKLIHIKFICIDIILLLLPAALSANEFSLVTSFQNSLAGVNDNEPAYNLKVDLWPSLFLLIGEESSFTASAGLTLGMEDGFYFIPEILQTYFSFRFGISGIKVGRFTYSDPLSYVTNGLFDGVQFFSSGNAGRFNIGAWYTGSLYKKNANITMTDDDLAVFDKPVDYNDFFNTYFAPARVFGAIGWEHPSIGEFFHLNTAIIGQYDLTDSETQYHSQYFIIKASIPKSEFLIELGGCVSLSQTIEDENKFGVSFAGEAGFSWLLPTNFISRLSFTAKYASGKMEDSYEAFIPITTQYVGNLLEYKFSGISVLTLNYTARFAESLGAAIYASYFMRNDLGTIQSYPASLNSGGAAEGYFLGPETYLRMVWSPLSDLQFNIGGGAFFPSLGNAGRDEPIRWKADIKVIIAIL